MLEHSLGLYLKIICTLSFSVMLADNNVPRK